jgi:uncharacterized protein (DUF433 family)
LGHGLNWKMMENKARSSLHCQNRCSRGLAGILRETADHAENFSNTRWHLSRRGEKQMEKLDRITTDPARLNGEPCIRNLRLTVRRVLEAFAIYPDRAELKREYPELEEEDIRQALAFAAALVDDKVLPLPHAR